MPDDSRSLARQPRRVEATADDVIEAGRPGGYDGTVYAALDDVSVTVGGEYTTIHFGPGTYLASSRE